MADGNLQFEEKIEITPAWDKRSDDPKKNYGVGGVDLRFALLEKTTGTAMVFVLGTHWHWMDAEPGYGGEGVHTLKPKMGPMPYDLGYHSPKPMYDGQEPMERDDCPYVTGICYYDGSTLAAEVLFEVLLREGRDGVFRELREDWQNRFGENSDG
jgi:hypothetical protein